MKTALLVLCCLCASAAFGQSVAGGARSNEPQVIELPSHPQHATPRDMGYQESLLGESGPTIGHGVRPLWEVAPPVNEVPLGDVARAFRKEHEKAKKAVIVFDK
ncbi:MAG TPA: hypothetical protein VLV49_06660 [Terriglobales bacterium]|nr:hypothetical protein [Terriglobales bacterium]